MLGTGGWVKLQLRQLSLPLWMRTPPHILYPLPRPHLMWYLLLKLHLINSTPAHPRLYLLLRTPPLPSQCTVVWMWWKMHNPAKKFQILFLSWCPTRLSLLFQRPGNRQLSFFLSYSRLYQHIDQREIISEMYQCMLRVAKKCKGFTTNLQFIVLKTNYYHHSGVWQ